jgi:signal transduction histidine kinase/CheY-like chemotaxis protein
MWRAHRLTRSALPGGLPEDLVRSRYAALLACPLHFLSTSPYAVLFALFGAWKLSLLVLPLCLSYWVAWRVMRSGRHDAGVFLLLGSVTLNIVVFCMLLGRDSRLDVTLFYCAVAPFLFFRADDLRKIALANLFPALGWSFLELVGYRLVPPYALDPVRLELFRFAIMPTCALLLLVPLFFLLRGLNRTEGRLREALTETRRSSQAKSEFLALVSHELRTPLNGMLGILEMLEREGLNSRALEELRIARASGSLLNKVIGDILDFSRLEKGMTTLRPVPCDLPVLVGDGIALFESAAHAKGLRLEVEIDRGFPCVQLDPERFGQILSNLVGNAVKFTPSGSVRIHLAWRPLEAQRVRILCDVEDTGLGIPEDRRDAVFRPFVQLHRNLHANAQGCGLGLAVASQLAGLMGGTVEYSPNRPVGSRFQVRLVASTCLPETPAQGAVDAPSPSGKPFGGKVLVVDDVRVNQLVATRMLASLGFECLLADDGAMALGIWQSEDPQLIFMDLQMPVMDGFETCAAIRNRAREDEREAPVIVALTANTFDEHRELCRRSGMDGFLEKPLTKSVLTSTLLPLLRRRLPHMVATTGDVP